MANLLNSDFGNIEYQELVNSPEEAYKADEGQLTRTFLTAWDKRFAFYATMLGYRKFNYDPNAAKNYTIFSHPPLPYQAIGFEGFKLLYEVDFEEEEEDVGKGWLYATSVKSVQGIGPRAPSDPFTAAYDKAKITIGYEKLSYRVPSTASSGLRSPYWYTTRFLTTDSRIAHLPFGQMKYADGSGQVAMNTKTRPEHTLQLIMIWHSVPYTSTTLMDYVKHAASYVGCVNSAVFEGFSVGVVFMTSSRIQLAHQINGGKVLNATFTFNITSKLDDNNQTYFPERGHNYFYHLTNYDFVSTTGGAFDINNPNTPPSVYLHKDFDELFHYPNHILGQ